MFILVEVGDNPFMFIVCFFQSLSKFIDVCIKAQRDAFKYEYDMSITVVRLGLALLTLS